MPRDTHCTDPSHEKEAGSGGFRLPAATVVVTVALVLGAVLVSRLRIDVEIAVPTAPALIAAEVLRRLAGSLGSGRDRNR
ncbi:hypothetical protein AB0M28_06230 [Streptomyces sp. NPDC051940]|uniref:hypothetical protein n=1 Tax=Streptomyces sp. NPDC051940 TaxID=3155675 RepID=UPI003414F3D2